VHKFFFLSSMRTNGCAHLQVTQSLPQGSKFACTTLFLLLQPAYLYPSQAKLASLKTQLLQLQVEAEGGLKEQKQQQGQQQGRGQVQQAIPAVAQAPETQEEETQMDQAAMLHRQVHAVEVRLKGGMRLGICWGVSSSAILGPA
jgi:hypothetical protein